MVINEKHKFIFIHVYRTGGTSIDWAFGRRDRHDTHQKLETIPNWEKYFSFAFVRNPWDRTVSSHKYQTKTRQFSGTFEEYVRRFSVEPLNTTKKYAQYNMVENCSYIGRFEHLQEDFNEICGLIGIEPIKLPHVWKTEHKHYSELYTDELRDIIAEAQSGDTETFGFDFNSTATKNVGKLK